MFYKSVLQSVLSFGLIVFGNMWKKDRDTLQRQIKIAGKITGLEQEAANSMCTKLNIKKLNKILEDSTSHFTTNLVTVVILPGKSNFCKSSRH